MKLEEIAAEYTASLAPLRARMKELRTRINEEEDPVEVDHLKDRYNALVPILRETRELVNYCKNYYSWRGCNGGQQTVRHEVERVDWRHDGLEEDDCCNERRPDVPAEEKPSICHGAGTDTTPAGDSGNEHLPKQKRTRNRKRTERPCVDSIPHFDAGQETLTESGTLFLLKKIFG